MPTQSAEFAIIGAGPAGAHLASRLAGAGRDVLLLDPKGAWEKPCGGGVPTRALREFGFLMESSGYPRSLVRRITLISPSNRRVTVKLRRPFAVYSRRVLNGLVLDRAVEAGARFVQTSVSEFERTGGDWLVTDGDGRQYSARFLIGADGAASFTRRRLIGIFPLCDLALAFGYNVVDGVRCNSKSSGIESDSEDDSAEAIVKFPRNFTGYLWAFPRPGVMNFGVASKLGERSSDELRNLLNEFVSEYYGGEMPTADRLSFFGAKIPTLEVGSWSKLQTTGEGWALVGDAAGFADPITGEGLYYALKSADLFGDALETSHSIEAGRLKYDELWQQAFGMELRHASYRLPQFYHGYFLGQIFIDAMIRLAKHHRGVRTILTRALVGDQSYVTLKRDLFRRAWQIF